MPEPNDSLELRVAAGSQQSARQEEVGTGLLERRKRNEARVHRLFWGLSKFEAPRRLNPIEAPRRLNPSP